MEEQVTLTIPRIIKVEEELKDGLELASYLDLNKLVLVKMTEEVNYSLKLTLTTIKK